MFAMTMSSSVLFRRPGGDDDTSRDLSSTGESNERVTEPLTGQLAVLPTPNPDLHQFTSNHYLSYIEKECHEQAIKSIKRLRADDDQIFQDHPEVITLGNRLFEQAVEQLKINGADVAEFRGQATASLRRAYQNHFTMALKDAAANAVANYQEREILSTALSPKRAATKNLLLGNGPTLYQELGVLGKGGFGKVYRIYGFLENKEYAVKKITISKTQLLQDEGELDSLLKEVRALAELQHPNIVQYFHSWLEPVNIEDSAQRDVAGRLLDDKEYTGSSYDTSAGVSSNHQIFPAFLANDLSDNLRAPFDPSDGDLHVSFGISSEQPGNDSQIPEKNEIRINETSRATAASQRASVQDASGDDAYEDIEEVLRSDLLPQPSSSSHPSPPIPLDLVVTKGTTLCIKMALHETTLSSYLGCSSGPSLNHCYHTLPAARIFSKILDGVRYLHSNNIVHRDLKPANILLSLEKTKPLNDSGFVVVGGGEGGCHDCCENAETVYIRPCVADFGLIGRLNVDAAATVTTATTTSTTTTPTSQAPSPIDPQRHPVGTKLYRPPSDPPDTIHPKFDVYSLGVILFELLTPFPTEMERRNVLGRLGSTGEFPVEFEEHEMFEGVRNMIRMERDRRWGMEEVMKWLERWVLPQQKSIGASSSALNLDM